MSNVRMVQEGDVIDLPNAAATPTVAGALTFQNGYVGQWNEGGIAQGGRAPLIVRGVIQRRVAAPAGGIDVGEKLALNTVTGQLVPAPVDAVWDMEEADEDDLVSFGRSLTKIAANTTALAWVRIKPQ